MKSAPCILLRRREISSSSMPPASRAIRLISGPTTRFDGRPVSSTMRTAASERPCRAARTRSAYAPLSHVADRQAWHAITLRSRWNCVDLISACAPVHQEGRSAKPASGVRQLLVRAWFARLTAPSAGDRLHRQRVSLAKAEASRQIGDQSSKWIACAWPTEREPDTAIPRSPRLRLRQFEFLKCFRGVGVSGI